MSPPSRPSAYFLFFFSFRKVVMLNVINANQYGSHGVRQRGQGHCKPPLEGAHARVCLYERGRDPSDDERVNLDSAIRRGVGECCMMTGGKTSHGSILCCIVLKHASIEVNLIIQPPSSNMKAVFHGSVSKEASFTLEF